MNMTEHTVPKTRVMLVTEKSGNSGNVGGKRLTDIQSLHSRLKSHLQVAFQKQNGLILCVQ